MTHTGRAFFLVAAIFALPVMWFLYSWYVQLTEGLGVTGMRTPVGAAWGVYIAQFVFFVCLAHGGIAVAAAVRLLNLKTFAPVARIGELLTIVSIGMAGLSIMIDMVRPDRIFNIVLFWPQRAGSSPLSWDVTVIIIYFILSVAYLWLTMRRDLVHLIDRFPRLAPLYKVLSIGYRPDEDKKVGRMSWWLSAAVCFLIVMLSGGVVAWIFGLLPSRPGWFGALAGPYFLTAAITSAIGAVILAAGILRFSYRWQNQLKPQIFKGLGTFLGIGTLFYVYMMFSEHLTNTYAGPLSEALITQEMLTGQFAPIFWPMLIFGFVGPALTLLLQVVRPKMFSVTRTIFAAGTIVVAFWVKRFLIVVPSLMRPLLPFPQGSYSPSWVEWSIIAGTWALAVLMFMAFLKIFPIMELEEHD